MRVDFRKIMLAGTAIVAVGALLSPVAAQAQADLTLTANDTWADADGGDLDPAVAGDNVDVDTFTMTVTNDGVNDDGSVDTNTFVIGNITDFNSGGANTGSLIVRTGSNNLLTTTINSVSLAASLVVDNRDADNASNMMAVTNNLTLSSTLSVTNAETDTDTDVELDVGGDLFVNGVTTLTATNGGGGGGNVDLFVSGDAAFTAGLTLNEAGAGVATLGFDGTTAQDVTGIIDGGAAGQGQIEVENAAGVTFSNAVGGAAALRTIIIENTGGSASATFENTVSTTGGILLGTDGAAGTNTVTFDGSGGGFTVTGGVTGTAGETNNIVVSGGNTITEAGAWGAGNINNVSLTDTGTTLSLANTLTASTVTGGTGTQTITTAAGITLAADISGVENINQTAAAALNVSGSITDGTIGLNASGSSLIVNAAGETIAAAVTGQTGAAEIQTVQLVDGTMSGTMSLGDGADVFDMDGGTFSGTADLGAGVDNMTFSGGTLSGTVNFGADADTLTVDGGPVTIGGALSNLETVVSGANTINLSAAITGVDDADNTGVNLAGGTLNINSGGSVDGAIHEGGGAGTVNFGANSGGGTFNLGGIIEGVTMTLTSGTLDTNGFALGATTGLAAVNVNGGTFRAYDNVVTTTAVTVGAAGSMVIGSGAVVTAADVDVAGTLTINVDATANFGSMVLTNDIDISGGTITVAVETGDLADGDELLIADGNAVVNAGAGQAATTVVDNSFIWAFQVADGSDAAVTGSADNQDLYLIAIKENSIPNVANTSNNRSAGIVIDSLVGTTDPQLSQIVTNLNSSSSAAEINDILESIQPTIDGAAVVSAVNAATTSFSVMNDRLAYVRNGRRGRLTGVSTGGYYRSSGARFWAQGFGGRARQDARDGIDGYDADTYGGTLGVDTEDAFYDTVIGLAFSYANTDVDSENANNTQTDVSSYQFAMYGDYDIDRRTYFNSMIAYTFSDNDTQRSNIGGVSGLTAQGEFDSHLVTARAEMGRDVSFLGTTLTPNIMGHWSHYSADGYTEKGAGGANLEVDMDNMDILELGAGLDLSWIYRNYDGSYFAPELEVGYRHDFADDKVEMTSRFTGGGGAFRTEGFNAQQDTLDLGAGFTYYSTDNWELSAEYDFELKEDYDAHSGLVRAAYVF